MRKKIIKLLGGFSSVDEAILHIKNINDEDKKAELLREAVKKLYNVVGPEEILKQEGNTLVFKDRPLTEAEVKQLVDEAQHLQRMKLWFYLKRDVRYQLGRKMFEEARVKEDMLWGQLSTFLWDVIQTRLKNFK